MPDLSALFKSLKGEFDPTTYIFAAVLANLALMPSIYSGFLSIATLPRAQQNIEAVLSLIAGNRIDSVAMMALVGAVASTLLINGFLIYIDFYTSKVWLKHFVQEDDKRFFTMFLVLSVVSSIVLCLVPQYWYIGVTILYWVIRYFLKSRRRGFEKAIEDRADVKIEKNIIYVKNSRNEYEEDRSATTRLAAIRGIYRNFATKGTLFGLPIIVTIALCHILLNANSGAMAEFLAGAYVGISAMFTFLACGGMAVRVLYSMPYIDQRIELNDHEYFRHLLK
ncbi:hypothetical protein [Rhizobium sp. PP-CC-3G-465]|uniref:hypothetical protein n=1 Tax=Rhizobium sp. PP-CC-3G-465 TaxID=2135648 RepID=UPI00104DBBBD|nr:hypothetical protein C8J33_11238 [Rhizobium sp. PP-CC-3G-465]